MHELHYFCSKQIHDFTFVDLHKFIKISYNSTLDFYKNTPECLRPHSLEMKTSLLASDYIDLGSG